MEKGMLDGQKIVLDHEGDQASGVESGDVVVVLHEQKHDFFQRSCSDLIMVVKVWSLFFSPFFTHNFSEIFSSFVTNSCHVLLGRTG